MKYDNVPDRRLGLVAGLMGGVVGIVALRIYMREIEPGLLPTLRDIDTRPLGDVIEHHGLDDISLLGTQYQPNESSSAAAGRYAYQFLEGAEPDPTTLALLTDGAQFAWGLLAGAGYGGTRTTTAPRDLASGFFYGIRLWMGDAVLSALLGFRPGPTAQPVNELIKRLIRTWVYTFTTTQVTRLVYLFLDPDAWAKL